MLDKIVEGATTEFEIFRRLLSWGYTVPVSSKPYSWDYNEATIVISRRDMPYLHGSYARRRRNAAYSYATKALMGGLISMGYQARHVNINTAGGRGYGHGVVEVWSNQFNKWVMLDPVYETFYSDPKTNIPLGVIELHDLLSGQYPGPDTWQKPFAIKAGKKLSAKIDVKIYEGLNNQYAVEEKGRLVLTLMGNFRIIPRNDFLSNPLPIPTRHGYTSWGWDGYLNYYDNIFGKRSEFQRNTDRPVDFYAPLNQSQVFLSETDNAGVLKVEVDTFCGGGFGTFMVRINDGQWAEQKESQWMWNLTEGRNKIEVKAKNVREITGPTSVLIVTYSSL